MANKPKLLKKGLHTFIRFLCAGNDRNTHQHKPTHTDTHTIAQSENNKIRIVTKQIIKSFLFWVFGERLTVPPARHVLFFMHPVRIFWFALVGLLMTLQRPRVFLRNVK